MNESPLGRRRFLHTAAGVAQTATLRKAAVTTAAAFAVVLAGGCGTTSETEDQVAQESAGATSTPAEAAPAGPPEAACPLVDTSLLPTLFKVSAPQLKESDPRQSAGNVTTYACDVSDGGELFATVGVSVGPRSGTAEANVSAALEGAASEPVSGVGDAGAFGVNDGVGTVAGMKTVGGKAVIVFVHGDPGSKKQLISVARSAAAKV